MNVELLNRVKRAWKTEPRRLNMHLWLRPSNRTPCKTTGCIAGWTALLAQIAPSKRITASAVVRAKLDVGNPASDATLALRIGPRQAARLFYVHNWPQPFQRQFYAGTSAQARVAVAIKRVNLFIRTNGKK